MTKERKGFSLINGSQRRKGFSLVELIVIIAIIGILVMLGTPKLLGYVEKSEFARIKHDVKVMEDKVAEQMISDNKEYLSWENNIKELGKLAMADMLFETKGLARGVVKPKTNRYGDTASGVILLGEEKIEHKDYKIVPNSAVKEIKSKLPGTFYSNIDGKVYYEHGKPLTGAKEDIVLGCEAPEPLDYEFDEITGTIVKYNGNLQHLVIPSAFKVGELCYPVRIIGRGAFMGGNYGGVEQRPIKSVIIPPSVEIIEEDAFKDNELKNIVIPPSVTNIGDNAFAGNNLGDSGNNGGSGDTGSTGDVDSGGSGNSGGAGGVSRPGVIIQNSVGGTGSGDINVSNSAFSSNGPLGSSAVAPQYRLATNKDLKVNINVTTNEKGGKIGTITDYDGTDTSVIIPTTIIVNGEEVIIEKIDKGAYQGKGLISVRFPDGLKRIEDYAFAGNQLIGAIIPTSVEHIGDYAFGFNEITLKSKTKATIRSINILEDEKINKLDINGNILDSGAKADKLKKDNKLVNLLDYIFITSKSNLVIDVGSDVVISNGYSREEIQKLIDNGYIPISTSEELNNIRNSTINNFGKGSIWENKYIGGLNKNYIQVSDIDMKDIKFHPIGDYSNPFRGKYDGNNYTINNLHINRNMDSVGLFGGTNGAIISNIGLKNVDIKGNGSTGALAGSIRGNTLLTNSYSTGSVKGGNNRQSIGGLAGGSSGSAIMNSFSTANVRGAVNVGGLVGNNHESLVKNSYSTGDITGVSTGIGGLVGSNNSGVIEDSYSLSNVLDGAADIGGLVGYSNGTIKNSYSVGSTKGQGTRVGGLVGRSLGAKNTITDSYSRGDTIGYGDVGGLVGFSRDGLIEGSYSSGTVMASRDNAGGLVGLHRDYAVIKNSYSTVEVSSGNINAGGLVGHIKNNSKVVNSYSMGNVEGVKNTGGLIGYSTSSQITNSYYDKETSGKIESAGGTGELTLNMKNKSIYVSGDRIDCWNFDTVWIINPGRYPTLKWQE